MATSKPLRYWSVDFPGMTEQEARVLADESTIGSLGFGLVVDPKIFLTLHLDAATVVDLLSRLGARPGLDENSAPSLGLESLMTEWLDDIQQ